MYEDDVLIVVNKPRGLLVHPTDQSSELTLVHGLLAHCGSLADGESDNRPGIVHRLDRFTEGVLVVAKTNDAFNHLKEQFKERQVEKRYYAMLKGALAEDEYHLTTMMGRHRVHRQKQTSRSPVPGTEKEAISIVSVKKRFNTKTFCDIQILTGRTHQIRVHCAEMGHPVIGDSLYDVNSGKKYDGQQLQCYSLQFKHPETLKDSEFKVVPSVMFS